MTSLAQGHVAARRRNEDPSNVMSNVLKYNFTKAPKSRPIIHSWSLPTGCEVDRLEFLPVLWT